MMFPLNPTLRRDERLTDDEFYAFCQANPTLRIEREADDEKYTLPAKMEKYLQNGVQLGWVIDPFSQQTTIYRPDSEPTIKPFSKMLSDEVVLPGFELRLSDLL